jgi:hypothetical protein
METWVILVTLAIFLFYIWQTRSPVYYEVENKVQAIPPDIISAIIDKIQEKNPDEAPLETIFINKVGTDTYAARFMFFNTQHYFGTQYDVQARVDSDGSVTLVNLSGAAQVDNFDSGFKPFKSDTYQDYKGIEDSLNQQLQAALKNPPKPAPLGIGRRAS